MGTMIKGRLSKVLQKDLLIDLEDRIAAEALKAFEMVRDRAGLDKKRARELEGQARFRMMEQGFQEVCELHGGRLLEGGVIPNSDLKVYQPFMRLEAEDEGVVLGLAAMPDPNTVPPKNKSRLAGVSMNFSLSPRLDLDGSGPKSGDIFVLFLVSRHREKAGKIEEVAVGVVSSNYESFLFYEPIEKFLSEPILKPATASPETSSSKLSTIVKLKKNVAPFVPPEVPTKKNDDESGVI